MNLLQLSLLQNNRSIFLAKLLLLVWLCLAASPLWAEISPMEKTPSFDCKKAKNKTEMLICSSYMVKMYDFEIANLYKHLKLRGLPVEKMHKKWLESRHKLNTAEALEESYEQQMKALRKIAAKERDVYNLYYYPPNQIYTTEDGRRFFINDLTKRFINADGLSGLTVGLADNYVIIENIVSWFEANGKKIPQYDYLKELDFRNLPFQLLPYLGCILDKELTPKSKEREEFCKEFQKKPQPTMFTEEYQRGWKGKKPVKSLAKDCRFKGRYFNGKLQNRKGTLHCHSKKGTLTTLHISHLIFRDFNHDGYMDVLIAIGVPTWLDWGSINLEDNQYMFLTRTEPNQKQLTRIYWKDFPYMQNTTLRLSLPTLPAQ